MLPPQVPVDDVEDEPDLNPDQSGVRQFESLQPVHRIPPPVSRAKAAAAASATTKSAKSPSFCLSMALFLSDEASAGLRLGRPCGLAVAVALQHLGADGPLHRFANGVALGAVAVGDGFVQRIDDGGLRPRVELLHE